MNEQFVRQISTAALAVAGRAYLSMLTKSSGKPKSHERLVDIQLRWDQAERILGPGLETLPVILTIPVVLFLVGLLESVFSVALQSSHSSVPVIATAALSAATIASVGVTLLGALVHACLRPNTSPFRTTTSQTIRALSLTIGPRAITALPQSIRALPLHVQSQVQVLGRWISSHIDRSVRLLLLLGPRIRQGVASLSRRIFTHIRPPMRTDNTDLENQSSKVQILEKKDSIGQITINNPNANDKHLSISDCVYHAIVQATHDDDLLDQAAAAFTSICEHSSSTRYYRSPQDDKLLANLEINTLIHLLSPEASYRCNLTASESIMRLDNIQIPNIPGMRMLHKNIQYF